MMSGAPLHIDHISCLRGRQIVQKHAGSINSFMALPCLLRIMCVVSAALMAPKSDNLYGLPLLKSRIFSPPPQDHGHHTLEKQVNYHPQAH